MDAIFYEQLIINFRSKCRRKNKQVVLWALYLDLEDLKQSKSYGGEKMFNFFLERQKVKKHWPAKKGLNCTNLSVTSWLKPSGCGLGDTAESVNGS